MTSVKTEASKVASNPAVNILVRIGDGARGYLFFVLGLLALQMALGKISGTADYQGAIAATAANPLGKILLIIVLIGLCVYVLWALAAAFFDLLHVGHGLKGLFKRAVLFVNAVIYGLLIPMLVVYVSGGSTQSGSQNFNIGKLASSIFLLPYGKWLVAAVGAALFIGGLFTVFSGLRRNFDKEARSYSLSPGQVTWIKRVGRFGSVAYGAIIIVIGVLFFAAFTNADPYKATGIDGALLSLINLPFGRWLLGLIALGLISYGIYLGMKAVWFRTLSAK
jgi:hypothetical protein